MKVRALIEIPTTVDGKVVGPFRKNQEFDLDSAQAKIFIDSKIVEEVLPSKPAASAVSKPAAVILESKSAGIPKQEKAPINTGKKAK
jgi:hypothetical protein